MKKITVAKIVVIVFSSPSQNVAVNVKSSMIKNKRHKMLLMINVI